MFKFLNKCVQIEETAALIYHEFAVSKKCDQNLTAIWLKMARDEEDHAQQLKLAMRLLRNNIASRSRDKSADPDELNELASSILAKAKNGRYELMDMLKDAVILEDSFLHIHVTHALKFKDPSLLDTFRRLAREDEVHAKNLNKYLTSYKEEHHLGSLVTANRASLSV